MTHETLHRQSEVQKQQLQSEQHPEEINFTFMWSVTILLFVLLIWCWCDVALKCSFLNQNNILILCWIPFEIIFWEYSAKPIHLEYHLYQCNQILLDCCFMLARWHPYTWNQVTGQRVVYNYFSLSLLLCRRQGFFGGASLRQETETKELLYCGKGQRSWLFLRQADTVAVLKSTVKLDNKIVKQEHWNRESHTRMPQCH